MTRRTLETFLSQFDELRAGMFAPDSYAVVTNFVSGAWRASPDLLGGLQIYVWELTDSSPVTWPSGACQ